jgi:hypothetical protein
VGECTRCGRLMKTEGAVCKFCLLEEAELQAAKCSISPESTGPDMPVGVISVPVCCPYCGDTLPENLGVGCPSCGLVLARCRCEGVNVYFPVKVPHPTKDLLLSIPYYKCAHCHSHIDVCAVCLSIIDYPPARCNYCQSISLWGYEGELKDSGMIVVLEEVIGMIDDAANLDDVIKIFNVHSRLKRIILGEQSRNYKPITVAIGALKETCREINDLAKWFSNVYDRKVTNDPSMSNVLSNAQAATNMNAAFGRATALVTELVYLAESSYQQVSFHIAHFAVYCAVKALSQLNALVSSSCGETTIVKLSGINLSKYRNLLGRTTVIIEQYSPKTADEIRVLLS